MMIRCCWKSCLVLSALFVFMPKASAVVWLTTWDGDGEWARAMEHGFQNIADIRNEQKPTRGTGIYLQDGWVLSSRHVLEDEAYGGPVAAAEQVKVNLPNLGGWYDAAEVVTHGGWDVVLIRLTEVPREGRPERLVVNASFDEVGRVVEFGGYGWWGPMGESLDSSIVFHRAQNTVASETGGDFQVVLDDEEPDVQYPGIISGGDSGGPVFMRVDDRWVLCGVVRASNLQTGQFVRTSMIADWIEASIPNLTWHGDPPSVREAAEPTGEGSE